MYQITVDFINLIIGFSIPLLITALGGMFTERSGVTNIALEGLMIIGAFIGIITVNGLYPVFIKAPQLLYIIGVLIAAIGGMAFSYFHAVASIKMKADQIISATAINTLTPALVMFLTVTLGLGVTQSDTKLLTRSSELEILQVPILSKIPIIGDLFFEKIYLGWYIGLAILIISSIILYKTKFGLRLRSCGENPHAADAAGINIYKLRYAGVLISGALAGMGGYFLLSSGPGTSEVTVSGYGFLAIAIVIFGNWKPYRIALTTFLFSSLNALSHGIANFPSLEKLIVDILKVDPLVLSMLPYIATIIVLILSSKTSAAPKAVGQIYDQSGR